MDRETRSELAEELRKMRAELEEKLRRLGLTEEQIRDVMKDVEAISMKYLITYRA